MRRSAALSVFSIVFVGMLLGMLCVVFLPAPAMASSERIYSIDTDVVLEEDGTASVTQTWKTHTEDGTEFFIDMSVLGQMKIEDFTVEGPSGKYETVPSWDVKASFDQKAGKAGVQHTDKGQELCWGKTSYGDNTYVVRWKYRNAVQGYSDYDGFTIRFINSKMDPAPERAKTTIRHAGGTVDKQTTRIWAFGYPGSINFQDDGTVAAQTSSAMGSSNHMTITMQFNKGTFHPTLTHRESFVKAVRDKALEDSDYVDNADSGSGDKTSWFSRFQVPTLQISKKTVYLLGGVVIAVLVISFFRYSKKLSAESPPPTVSVGGQEYIDVTERIPREDYEKYGEWSRDIPLNNNLLAIYHAGALVDPPMGAPWTDLMSAYMLKWVKEGAAAAQVRTQKEGVFVLHDVQKTVLVLAHRPEQMSDLEADLWEIVRESAWWKSTLDGNSLEQFSNEHRDRVFGWLVDASKAGREAFIKLGGLAAVAEEGSPSSAKRLEITPLGREQIAGYLRFRQYLKDFTLINERGIEDVHLWDDYLIAATLMGLGEEVSKQMEELRPDYRFAGRSDGGRGSAMSRPVLPSSLSVGLAQFGQASEKGMAAANTGTSSSSGFFGGGGFSSLGGGGGFSGGGFGGGSR